MTERDTYGGIGPPIPAIPYEEFSKARLTHRQMCDAWRLCGPSVAENMRRDMPLWKIITMAYLEGLEHGSASERKRVQDTG